jgi:hypothetical protein
MTRGRCLPRYFPLNAFVIQPFDRARYDKRCEDIFTLAIGDVALLQPAPKKAALMRMVHPFGGESAYPQMGSCPEVSSGKYTNSGQITSNRTAT